MDSKETSKTDVKMGLAFAAFAALALEESLRMPVYDDVYTAPGLFPAFLSFCIIAMSLGLVFWGRRRSKLQTEGAVEVSHEEAVAMATERKRLFLAIGLILLYCFVFLGHINYTLATFLFLVLSMSFFKATKIHWIVIISALASLGISYLFGKIFLIPLP
jgi:fatty acid desaturase